MKRKIIVLAAFVACGPPPSSAPTAPKALVVEQIAEPGAARQLMQIFGLISAGESERALERLSTLVGPPPLEPAVLRVMAYQQAGRIADAQQALEVVERLLAYQGHNAPFVNQSALVFAAQALLDRGDGRAADSLVEELIRRFPRVKSTLKIRLLRATRALESRRLGLVFDECQRLLRVYRDSAVQQQCRWLLRRAERRRALGPQPDRHAARWQWRTVSPTKNRLRAVWIGPGRRLTIVGERGTILQGQPLALRASPTRQDLYALAGRAFDDLYAVGALGVVLHHDGKVWQVVRAPRARQGDLFSATVDREGVLWAVGERGEIVAGRRGQPFRTIEQTKIALRGISFDGRRLWIVGDDGAVFAGEPKARRFVRVHSDSYQRLWGVASVGDGRWHAVGDGRTVVSFDGSLATEDVIGLHDFRGVAADGGEVWLAGEYGVVYRRVGKRWSRVSLASVADLWGVASRSGYSCVVGDAGVVACGTQRLALRYQGEGIADWVDLAVDGSGVALLDREGRLFRLAGKKQRAEAQFPHGTYNRFFKRGNLTAAVGRRGLLALKVGGRIRQLRYPAVDDFNDLTAYRRGFVAVGQRGAVVEIAPTGKLKSLPTPTPRDLSSVAAIGEQLWVVGASGSIFRWSDGRWLREDSGTHRRLSVIRAGPRGRILAGGEDGLLLERDHATARWRALPRATAQRIVDLVVTSDRVIAIGEQGVTVRIDRGAQPIVDVSPASCLSALAGDGLQLTAVGCRGVVVDVKLAPVGQQVGRRAER